MLVARERSAELVAHLEARHPLAILGRPITVSPVSRSTEE
jgi:hypothetical protein